MAAATEAERIAVYKEACEVGAILRRGALKNGRGGRMRAKICAEAGCGALIPQDKTYCDKHKREKPAPFRGAVRSNEEFYNTQRWKKLRRKILKRIPYCANCGEHENDPALEIHHVKPPRGDEELFFDGNNLIPVCPACHKRLTALEIYSRRFKVWSEKIWKWEKQG